MQIKRPFILDIWEANTVTDWKVADGYFICASWNLQMGEDKNFGISWNGAGQAKKPRGAYFSVNMNLSIADQAKAFVAIINKNGGLKPGDRLAADCEVGQLSISAIIDFIWNVEQLTGIRPMLYSRANLLNALNFGKLNAGQLAYVKSVDLWSAGYPSNPDLYSTPPSGYIPDPSAYGPVKIWQYAGDVVPSDVGLSGVSGGIDLNWIDSTFFTQWQGETSAQQPAPTPQPVPAPIPAPLPEPTPAPTGTNIGSQIHHEDSGSVGSPYDSGLPTPLPIPPVPIPSGDLWYLKTLEEYSTPPKFNGSFAAIGGRGQDNWIEMQKNEIKFIQSVGQNAQLWKWAATLNAGTIYIRFDEVNETTLWPIILMSSRTNPLERQIVRVLETQKDNHVPSGISCLIDAIPYQANGDYSAFSPDKHPEYWLKSWTAFQSGSYGASHNGMLFQMPIFAPMTGFKISNTVKSIGGLWIDQNVLYGKV